MSNTCTSVFPNTHVWEQQQWNKTKKQAKNVWREAWVWKEVKHAQKKKKSQQLKLSLSKYNNDKHNLLVFYKRWKNMIKYN